MSKTQVITLRVPVELKRRLEREADYQGVSVNQLSNYLLAVQVTQLEAVSTLESRLQGKSIPELREKVARTLDKIPARDIPDWDRAS